MKLFKTYLFYLISFLMLFCFAGINNIQAESNAKTLSIKDVKLWRNHSLTLSDNGKWYTVLYSLNEKPEPQKDAKEKSKDEKEKDSDQDIAIYGENARTDVLYICQVQSGVKYQVPKASKPKFSSASGWIAYQIKPESSQEKKKKSIKTIELKNLTTGETKQYKSNAEYMFTENGNYFVTSDKNSLLIYDLENMREHYIGNTGEFLSDKISDFFVYTISSQDKRGNGIYLYNPKNQTTRTLQTGNFLYSNLSWNKNKNALAALKYKKVKEKIDFLDMRILVITGIDSDHHKSVEYKVKDITGMPKNMGPAVKLSKYPNKITWSNDDERLFINIKKYEILKEEKKEQESDKKNMKKATVDIWHWKDKKLISQQMAEEKKKKNEVYKAIFHLESQEIIRLTDKKIQRLIISPGTDKWAVGTDNREYISDWDVPKNDLYQINLSNGKKKLIEKKYSGRVNISPNGDRIILWKDGHYWCYCFKDESKQNITSGLEVSFINKEYDHYGYNPAYGFGGWVKDQDAVIVNHKLDLWLLPLNNNVKAKNLTKSDYAEESIRFRIDDLSFRKKPEIEDRYIDLSTPIILYAFNIKTKYAGYYQLSENKLKKLIYKPASYSASSRWRSGLIKAKNSDVIIYKFGSYRDFPEAYLSNNSFSKSKKITSTNPQQVEYKWGHRILIDYTNDDGVPLQGVLSIPDDYKTEQKLPMIVYSYEKMSQTMYAYSSPRLYGSRICEMMYVSDGYLFLRPDIHFNIGTPHSDMHECIDAAIKKVIELGYADEKYIGYEGFSFGGHCGMFISTQDNRFAAIAAGAGVSNLVQGFNIDIVRDGSNEQDYYITGQGRLGTDPTKDREMFLSESAVFNAQNMNTPLLLFHGTVDKVVQWEHSFGLYSILRFLKKPVIFLSYRDEGHGLREKANRTDIQTRLKEFFDHYLKGKQAPQWIVEGLPFQPEKKSGKKKTKEKEEMNYAPHQT